MSEELGPRIAKSRATMNDVARHAGVSLKTVSRVVNGEPGVVAELSARVRDAIAALNYEPNLSARSLRRLDRRSSTIAVLLEDLSNPYSAHVLRAIEGAARQRGVSLLAASLEENPDRERQLVRAMSRHRVDGVIIAPASDDQGYITDEQRAGVPFVFVDRPPRNIDADAVIVDSRAGTRRAVAHLIAHGHRRIGFLGDLTRISTAHERLSGYRTALGDAGIAYDPTLVVADLRSVDAARAAALRLRQLSDPPTAFFAGQNLLTMGVVYALRDRAESHAVAVVGFDDFDLADMLDPPVTVVAQDLEAIGLRAADLLFARIDGDGSPARLEAPVTTLIARGSGEIAGPESRPS